MKLREFFSVVGGSYEKAMTRLMNDSFAIRFIRRYPSQPEFGVLVQAVREGKWEEGFRAAHTLKGIALNLGLDSLGQAASDLCEELRGGEPKQDLQPLVSRLTEEQEKALQAIAALEE
ncbi:MAG: Hpt domain-containing protein [Clostridia bacterium]|nr:Hpt domain-containing protein [Clostridia bacterium]